MDEDGAYSLTDLAGASGIPVRTLRYYLAQGLLPAPSRRGRLTRYPEGTLRRLQLLKRLRAAHLPLAEIRERLDVMSDADVVAALAPRGVAEQLGLKAGLDIPSVYLVRPPVDLEPLWPASPHQVAERPSGGRTQWDRIFLEPGVELHVQRPLSRLASKRVERLVAIARDLLEADLEGTDR
jgi:DNA-binding transcriptional MerR regulator